jgi:tetratricopeptide (TPR) repeat protein
MTENRVAAAWARHEPILDRFEAALLRGERPCIDDFVPPDDPDRRALLLELARAELECRLKAGEPAVVEDYLNRYAELAEERDAVLTLIRVERDGRARRGSAIATEEFAQRFSHYLGRPTVGPPGGAAPVATRHHEAAETTDDAQRTCLQVGDTVRPARSALPSVPGFEVLGLLGRGGMGIVYQARQISLKRLVALKMLSAGGHAGPDELARFKVEAEAAARLQHPNIVQIHEVGTCAGGGAAECPYMALEFVEGGSLAQHAARGPLSPDCAAELVAVLARAMHHAHEKGVIHRDLKPANVLLTADRTPKITDFGLAKQLEGDSARTATGAVMGTPAYMAPEQAAGRTKEIGPLSDVYSLGAILYELLAGRPPFAGDSVMQMLEQVREHEPLPPSHHRKVPRDLETICLKCLQKEPARRYASARELAEDLERFRAGEPLRARRQGPIGKIWRRVRRRPRVAVAVLAVVIALVFAAGAVLHFRDKGRVAERVTTLRQDVINAREKRDDSEEHVAEVERLIDQLAQASPEAAVKERELLAEHVDALITERIRGRLGDEQLASLRASIDRVAARSEERAQKLRAALDARLRDWIEVFRIEGPEFAEREKVFGPGGVIHDGALKLQPSAEAPSSDLVLTRQASPVNAQMTAIFAPAEWETAPRVGVALSVSATRAGYALVLSAGRPKFADRPATLGDACRGKVPLLLQVLRDGRLMREQQVDPSDLAGRPLTLSGQRVGVALACQVNGRKPLLSFRDPFAPGAAEGGSFAVIAPAGVRLSSLVADRLSQAAAPRPLERGDELFDQRQFEQAADFYRKEAVASSSAEIGQEARYKRGLCLLALGRDKDAVRLLEEVASGDGATWPPLADCQLWAHALEQKTPAGREQAGLIRQRLKARGLSSELLGSLLPNELRSRIFRPRDGQQLTRLLLRPDEEALEAMEDAFDAQRLLEPDPRPSATVGLNLIKALRLAGQEEEALKRAQDLMSKFPTLDASDMPRQLLEQETWMLRLRGNARTALTQTQRYLVNAGELELYVLPDEARSLYATGQAAEAEQVVDRVLKMTEARAVQPFPTIEASLIKGFLRERAGAGDRPGAVRAWEVGLERYKTSDLRDATEGTLSLLLDYWIMAALADRLDDAEATRLRRRLLDTFASDPVLAIPINVIAGEQPPGVYRRMWQSERGRKIAGQIALREVTYADSFRLPVLLNLATTLQFMTLAGEPTVEQESLIWEFSRAGYAAFVARTLSNAQLTQLALTFVAAQAKAADVKLPDDVALRAPMAYLFGLRYVRKGNAKEAESFFAEALKAPPQDLAHRLAAKELERLKAR